MIPHGYDQFLIGIKNLAFKLSNKFKKDGSHITVNDEVNAINSYYERQPQGSKTEGSTAWNYDRERATAYKIQLDNFWPRIRTEGTKVVQIEGMQSKKTEGTGKIG